MCPKGVSPFLNRLVNLWLGLQQVYHPSNPKAGNLAICALFRDEAPYLEEWIEYHRLVELSRCAAL